jgi:formate dehydrogenase iron-sulfur subunit
MHKNEDGLTVFDERICISCNYCVANCPYGVITFDRTKGIMEKCSLCDKRVEKGLVPFCAEVCTPKAIKYGSRAQMIAAGNARVKMLKDQGYEEAGLYGVDEFGGLGVMLVLQHTPDKYNLPAMTEAPVGKKVLQYLLAPLGGVAALAAVGALIYNYTDNKKKPS